MGHIVGVYWRARRESKQDCSTRTSQFLGSLESCHPRLGAWIKKQRTRREPATPIPRDMAALESVWRSNRNDVGGAVLDELGFHLGAWSGTSTLSITCGASTPVIANCAVITLGEEWSPSTSSLREMLQAAVVAFEPEHGVAISQVSLAQQNPQLIWEAAGVVNYSRASGFRVSP